MTRTRAAITLLVWVSSSIGQEMPTSAPADEEQVIAADPAAEKMLLAAVGSGFAIRRTDHFVVAYDSDEVTLRKFISRLEATYDSIIRFCRINDITIRVPTRHLEVIFFNSHDDFCAYTQRLGHSCQNLSGFYYTVDNRAVFYNMAGDPALESIQRQIAELKERVDRITNDPAARRQAGKALTKDRDELRRLERHRDSEVERMNRVTVQHESAHLVFYNLGVHVLEARNPEWLKEGLACIFESPPTEDGAGIGIVNTMRLQDIQDVLQPDDSAKRKPTRADLKAAFAAKKLLPLGDLVSDPDFTQRDVPNLRYYYAEAWSLVYYLHRRRRDDLAAYIRLVSTRQPGEDTTPERELADFESVFGKIDGRFEQAWFDFVVEQFH